MATSESHTLNPSRRSRRGSTPQRSLSSSTLSASSHHGTVGRRVPRPVPKPKILVSAANIGSSRSTKSKPNDVSREAHQVVPLKRCHVCSRIGCPLISHRTYVFPTRPNPNSKTAAGAGARGLQSFTLSESVHLSQILELRSGRFDPFVNLPLKELSGDNDLFQYFFKVCAGRMVTATGRNATQNLLTAAMLPLALEYPAVCQGTITYAAAQLANIQGQTVPDRKNLAIQNKSMQLVAKLMKERPDRLKDVFMVSAISIAGFDLTYGRVDELRRHLDGLYKIVQSLGGLHNLGLGGLAAHLSLWIDFFGAIMLNRRPLYDLPSRPNITLPGPPHVYGIAFEEMLEKSATDDLLLSACTETCRLTELLEKITRQPGGSGEVEYFTYRRNFTDHQFGIANADHFGKSSRSSCVCLVSITLELWILHNVGDTHAIFHHLGIELRKALFATDLAKFWDTDLDLLQWILFSAGCIMNERNGHSEFCQLARQSLIHQYGVLWPLNWKDLQKQNLCRFIWSEVFLSGQFDKFCDAIAISSPEEISSLARKYGAAIAEPTSVPKP